MILNLLPQLPKNYRLALLKNEFGDVAIDSQLASSSAISGVQELLNGCICCNLVGQLSDALDTLRNDVVPDRIIIETSGSAFPATLAMEVNRLSRDSGYYLLDGVIVVIDVENWKGYEDTSYTAKLQARYTDLIVFNKWEHVGERRYEDCLDRVGDLDLQIASVKSENGRVDQNVLLGLDSVFAKEVMSGPLDDNNEHHHASDHQSEVEVLSVTLLSEKDALQSVDLEALHKFLASAPKDEIYRVKAVLKASRVPPSSDDKIGVEIIPTETRMTSYILNWAFERWTFTALSPISTDALSERSSSSGEHQSLDIILRMTIILARYEADKWKTRIELGDLIRQEGSRKVNGLRVGRKK